LLILLGVVAACVLTKSVLPAMYVFLPSFYGSIIVILYAMTQHLGLYEDVLDHRLNTRTMYLNPVLRFLYWNMNYHIEHHMFPMVPYHQLPKLHEEMKRDCPKPAGGLFPALREVIGALRKQRRNPAYVIVKPLPDTANPYMHGVPNAPDLKWQSS
jgi:fatty acid desaturase